MMSEVLLSSLSHWDICSQAKQQFLRQGGDEDKLKM